VLESSTSETIDSRRCITCGLNLVGPFAPVVTLTTFLPAEAEGQDGRELTVPAQAWICPGCGLVLWYTEEEHLGPLLDMAAGGARLTGEPGQSYQNRAHMLRMLRRVRRL
jgi:hypothetical protein